MGVAYVGTRIEICKRRVGLGYRQMAWIICNLQQLYHYKELRIKLFYV